MKVIAGCMATGWAPTCVAGSRTRSPWLPLVCTTYWPEWRAPLAVELADDVVEHVVRDGQQQHVTGAGNGGRLGDGDAGQQVGGAAQRGVGLAGDGDDVVAARAEHGGEDGTDAAGTDHAHT